MVYNIVGTTSKGKNMKNLIWKTTLSTILSTIILFVGSNASAEPLTINEIMEASCRVSVSGGIGSGTCIAKDGEHYIVLTNAHVVDRKTSANIEFFRDGYKTYKIPAKVIQSWWIEDTDKDFALIAVHEKYVSQAPPRIVPLIPVGYNPAINYVYSAGCPEGKWLKAWEGRIEKNEATRFIFTPPPVGGQSGSGLMVLVQDDKGELHTRVGGIVTFRVGDEGIFSDRMDENGYEMAKGAAIPISTLYKILGYDKQTYSPTRFSTEYKTVVVQICPHCKRSYADHALGDDSRHYCIKIVNGKMVCYPRPGVGILRWPDRGRIVPLPPSKNPSKPNDGNPFGDNLPNILTPFGDTDKTLPKPLPGPTPEMIKSEEEIARLQSIIDTLQQEVDTLKAQLSSSGLQNSELSTKKQSLEADLQNKLLEIEKYKQELSGLNVTIVDKDNNLSALNTHLDAITEQLTTTEENKESLSNEIDQNNEEKSQVKNQRNWLGGLAGTLGTGLLSSLGWMYWNRRGKQKAGKIAGKVIDNMQDSVDNRLDRVLGEDIVENLKDVVDNLKGNIGGYVDDAIRDTMPDILDRIIEKKTTDAPQDSVEVKIVVDNPQETKERPIRPTSQPTERVSHPKQKRRRKRRDKPVNFNITNTNTNTNRNDEQEFDLGYIKEFFNHKEKDGEKTEHWALRGILYKEAVDQLRRGSLYFKAKNKLQGQQETARQIDDWVRSQFMVRITKDILNQDKLYKEAMLGFLYKEAVAKLRIGEFDCLGYQATAQAIESWVTSEFLKRVGINI